MLQRTLGALVVLLISAAFAELAYFPGRSSNLVYSPNEIQDDSFLFLMDKYSGSTTEQITETNVADLISYLIGTPILNPTSHRDHFPQGSIFEKDRANVLIVVDAVGSDLIKSLPQLKTLQQSGQQYKIVKQFFPQDDIASLTTLFSGHGPSAHGVVNKTWTTDDGMMLAYSSLETSPQVANLADVVSQSFGGQSLVFSASSDAQVSSIFAVNRFANKQLNTNSFAYHYCPKAAALKSTSGSTLSTVPSTNDAFLAAVASYPYPLRSNSDSIKYSADTNEMIVTIGDIHATFNLNVKEEAALFAEIILAESMISSLKQDTLKTLVNDEVPDLFTFAFTAIRGLKNSNQISAAVLLLDGVMAKLTAELKSIYGRISAEIAFMGVPAYTRIQHDASYQAFKADVYTALKSHSKFIGAFPVVYTVDVQGDAACRLLKNQGLSSFSTVELSCKTSQAVEADGTTVGATEDPYPTYAEFQIVLWMSIVLALTLLATVYSMFSMNTGPDTFLKAPPMKVK